MKNILDILFPQFRSVKAGNASGADGRESVWVEIDDTVIDGDDLMAIIDPLWWEIDIYGGLEDLENSSVRFSEKQIHVHAILWYDCEVNNGGHHQFFANSTGIVWKRVLDGFTSVGMNKNTNILKRCLAYYGGYLPFDRAQRETLLDNEEFDFNDEDEAYYALELNHLDAELLPYIQAHREEFTFSGYIERPKG